MSRRRRRSPLLPILAKLTRGQRRFLNARRKLVGLACVLVLVAVLVLLDRYGFFGRDSMPGSRRAESDMEKYHGKTFAVAKVIDGDTLDVAVGDGKYKTTRIRLWGVDTPETVHPKLPPQHFGHEASAFTKRQCDGKQVRLQLIAGDTRGKYGRLLAYVHLPDGEMLNRVLVRDGYAYADPRFAHHYASEFLRLQDQAQRAGRGLWRDVRNDDLPPYYRNRLKLADK